MTFEEFAVLVKTLKAVYITDSFLDTEEKIMIWYTLLKDIDYKTAGEAVTTYITTNRWPPTPADIRAIVVERTAPPEESLNEEEAWALVTKAIRNSTYHAEEEFEALPEIVQKAIGDVTILKQMGQSSIESTPTNRAHFLKNYRIVVERQKNESATKPVLDTLRIIDSTHTERGLLS